MWVQSAFRHWNGLDHRARVDLRLEVERAEDHIERLAWSLVLADACGRADHHGFGMPLVSVADTMTSRSRGKARQKLIDEAGLKELQESFDADGYALDVKEDSDRVKAVISVAREDACSDCLVPPEALTAIMGQILGVSASSIDITYPKEA